MKKLGHHLIFEGAELTGKSYLMSMVYDFLEVKYNKSKVVLDGCHWFNTDVGVFGTDLGKPYVKKFTEMLALMKEKNILFEKFHISDIVYNRLHNNKEINYSAIEKGLLALEAKIIFCIINEDKALLQKRIRGRLSLYPHYERILRNPDWYIEQQREYKKEMLKTKLPYITIDMSTIPNEKYKEVLRWIGEK